MIPYERLDAWRLCHELTLVTYRLTRAFPADERFGLTTQARRAAFSATANIAEGCVKKGPKEFRRFLDISIGSLSELRYVLRLANDLGYLTEETTRDAVTIHDRASKATWGLYKAISRATTV